MRGTKDLINIICTYVLNYRLKYLNGQKAAVILQLQKKKKFKLKNKAVQI